MYLYLDIETLPAEWTPEQKAVHAANRVPANITKAETREKWIAENIDDCHRSTALDYRHGRVLCIGYAVDDEPVRVAYDATGNDPATLFDEIAARLRRTNGRRPTWVGHNIAGFDVPWLMHLAWKLRHPIATAIPWEKWGRGLLDTMEFWSLTDPRGSKARLGDIAAYLGIEGKGEGLDGSKVYDAWLAGEHDKIAAYCAQDVAMVRDICRLIGGAS